MKRILTGIACCFILGHVANSQSIYSFQGLGSLNHQGMPNNVAMGEVGIGSPSVWYINTQNPAHLVYNTLSTFQVGLELDRRTFSGDNVSGSATDGGLRFMGYAFPIMPGKWSSSFGVLPYSSVNYNSFSEGAIPGTTVEEEVRQVTNNRGEGGLTNFFWSNGFRIKKKFLVGIRAAYTFGSISKTSIISIGGVDVPVTNVSYEDIESYKDLNLLFGFGYRQKLSDEKFLNYGLTFSFNSALNGQSTLNLIRLSDTGIEIETVEVDSSPIDFTLPGTIGIGVSYQWINKYMFGLDIETERWSGAGKPSEVYNNAFKISVGGRWTPDFDNVNSYFKRMSYSIGFNYNRLPYIVNNQSLTDFGINFGASLPVSGFSSLDLAFKYGQLGESSNGLIKETYYKVVIGATINDRWFIKRKYD